jgi:hypothetical protein
MAAVLEDGLKYFTETEWILHADTAAQHLDRIPVLTAASIEERTSYRQFIRGLERYVHNSLYEAEFSVREGGNDFTEIALGQVPELALDYTESLETFLDCHREHIQALVETQQRVRRITIAGTSASTVTGLLLTQELVGALITGGAALTFSVLVNDRMGKRTGQYWHAARREKAQHARDRFESRIRNEYSLSA